MIILRCQLTRRMAIWSHSLVTTNNTLLQQHSCNHNHIQTEKVECIYSIYAKKILTSSAKGLDKNNTSFKKLSSQHFVCVYSFQKEIFVGFSSLMTIEECHAWLKMIESLLRAANRKNQ